MHLTAPPPVGKLLQLWWEVDSIQFCSFKGDKYNNINNCEFLIYLTTVHNACIKHIKLHKDMDSLSVSQDNPGCMGIPTNWR